MTKKKDIPVTDCGICSKLNNYEYASLLHRQNLPDAAKQLTGFERVNPNSGGFNHLECPICGTQYELYIDAEFMVHDMELKRIPKK